MHDKPKLTVHYYTRKMFIEHWFSKQDNIQFCQRQNYPNENMYLSLQDQHAMYMAAVQPRSLTEPSVFVV